MRAHRTFLLPSRAGERKGVARSPLRAVADLNNVPVLLRLQSAKKEQLVQHTTKEQFAQQRIREAQMRGEGSAKEAIACIFDHLSKTKSKVVDVFKKIDGDGNGELDADEFRLAMQMLGLDLPRSQAKMVLDEFDEDGNGTIDVEEFINKMRELARSRRAEQKAEAAIPDWIKEADKGKPPDRLDLGWRQLAPAKLPKPEPSLAEQAAAHFRANRPKSGGGTPFCSGGNGGRWRAGETSSMQGQKLDGWKAAHSGWQVNSDSEFGGIGERRGASHLGTKSFSSLGLGTKHATKRIDKTKRLAAHSEYMHGSAHEPAQPSPAVRCADDAVRSYRTALGFVRVCPFVLSFFLTKRAGTRCVVAWAGTHGNNHSKGVAEISVFQKSPRKLASSAAMHDTYSRSVSEADLAAFRAESERRLLASRDKDLELYGVDGERRVEGGSRPRGPTLAPAPSVEDASRIMALSHEEWHAFKAARFAEELDELQNR